MQKNICICFRLCTKNVASEISRLFVNCNILVYEIKVPDEFATIIRNIRKGDLFIIISLSGESKML